MIFCTHSIGRTAYGITTWSVVFAPDARTGKELWRWDPEVNQAVRPAICCGTVNRGIALYNGMIIAPSIDGRLFALNAQTGKPVWETRIVYTQDQYTLTMALSADKGEVLYEVKIARTGMAAPITYEVDGKQYVAFEGGMGRAATISGPNNAKVDGAHMMFVFTLDGKAELPAAAAPALPAAGPAPEQQN